MLRLLTQYRAQTVTESRSLIVEVPDDASDNEMLEMACNPTLDMWDAIEWSDGYYDCTYDEQPEQGSVDDPRKMDMKVTQPDVVFLRSAEGNLIEADPAESKRQVEAGEAVRKD